ncbi:MAG: hypothetical protein ACI8PZ_001305 [Myxococcota bacterium]|jgi:hypothetical protein
MLWWSCLAFVGRDAGPRPVLSGPEEVVVSADGTFLVHFTRDGGDAPDGADGDDGVPLAIRAVLDGLTLGERAFAEEGWRALTPDLGDGGSDAIDVYIMDLDANGYATPIPGVDGDSCYMRVDGGLGTLGEITESVALHELHHCIEYRYTRTHPWVHEAAATHAQYTHVLDPALELALGVLYGERLGHPERAADDRDGRFEYAGFLVPKYWADRAGTGTPLPDLWEALVEHGEDWESAFGAEARRLWDESLVEAWLEHATWNAFACATDDGQHYDPTALPCIAEVTVPVADWADGPLLLTTEASPYTAAYARIPGDGDGLEVSCRGPGRLRLVEVDADGARVRHADDIDGTARLDGVEHGALVVGLGAQRPLDLSCEVARVEAPVDTGKPSADLPCGCRVGVAPSLGIGWWLGRR